MASIIIGHREHRTLDTRNLNTTLYLLRYGDLCLRIDCSYWKYYLQPNCSAYRNKFKMVSKNIGHREPRTLDPRNVNTTLYRLRYGDLFLTIDCSYSKDYLHSNWSACINKIKMASKLLAIERLELSILAILARRSSDCPMVTFFNGWLLLFKRLFATKLLGIQ